MIRVCIVEDQTIVRQGLRSLLALTPDIVVAAEAADGVEAVEVIAAEKPARGLGTTSPSRRRYPAPAARP